MAANGARPETRPGGSLQALQIAVGLLAAVLLLALLLVTVVDVFGRYVLSKPLPGAFEVTGVLLAMAVFVALPLVCIREEHIAVTLLTDRLPTKLHAIHAALASLIGAVVLGLVAWQLAAHADRLAAYGEMTIFLRIPKAPLGYVMAGFTGLAALFLLLVALGRFRRATSSE